MKKIFDDIYINCRFACLFNVLKHFGVSPEYLLANNYYYIEKDIKNIYFFDNKSLLYSADIFVNEIKVVDHLSQLALKVDQVAIIKDMCDYEKTNTLILEKKGCMLRVLCQRSPTAQEFIYAEKSIDEISNSYNLYKQENYYSGLDCEATIWICTKKKLKIFPGLLPMNYIFYRVIHDNMDSICNNSANMKKILMGRMDIRQKIKFCVHLKKIKQIERYKLEKGIGVLESDEYLRGQIDILNKLVRCLYKSEDRVEQLVDQLCQFEDKIIYEYNTKFSFQFVINSNIGKKRMFPDRNLEENLVLIGGKIQSINRQNNSINGVLIKNNTKYFYKIEDVDSCLKEVCGYLHLCMCFPVPPLVDFRLWKDKGVITYKFEESVSDNKGLLNDYFINEEEFCIKDFLKCIKKNYECKKLQSSYPMQVFFEDRVESRLKQYLEFDWVYYTVDVGAKKKISTAGIIQECCDFFKKKRLFQCVLSHGDLNVMNIGTKIIFFDFVTSGYNYLAAEVATFSISVLLMDLFFSPKYHKKSYQNHEDICGSIPECQVNYFIIGKLLSIDCKIKTEKKRKELICEYLKNLIFDERELIYFIVMRLLTIFDIEMYETNDKLLTIYFVHYFYHKLKNKSFLQIVERIEIL